MTYCAARAATRAAPLFSSTLIRCVINCSGPMRPKQRGKIMVNSLVWEWAGSKLPSILSTSSGVPSKLLRTAMKGNVVAPSILLRRKGSENLTSPPHIKKLSSTKSTKGCEAMVPLELQWIFFYVRIGAGKKKQSQEFLLCYLTYKSDLCVHALQNASKWSKTWTHFLQPAKHRCKILQKRKDAQSRILIQSFW